MKTSLLFSTTVFFMAFSGASSSFAQKQSLKEEVGGIIQETKETNNKLSTDVQALFDGVKESIKETEKISKNIRKKFGDRGDQEFNAREQQEMLDAVKKIHEQYKRIDENREIFNRLLNGYDKNLDNQVAKAQKLLDKYQKELKESEAVVEELQMKSNRSSIDNQNLEYAKTDILVLKGIIKKLELVQIRVEVVKSNYKITNDEIAEFFNAIKNGTKTTQHMVDFFEISNEFDKLLKAGDDMLNLNNLTKGIFESLSKLSESIIELNKTKEVF